MLPILKITYESKRKDSKKLKTLFEKIARERNGEFKLIEERFQTKYQLRMEHLGQTILFQNNLGLEETGWVICKLETQSKISKFKIDEKFLLTQIIRSKADYLYFKSKDMDLKHFVKESEAFKALNIQARADAFQPIIRAKNMDGHFKIETRYHLDFLNRRDVIEPLIDFYESVIEYFDSRNKY